MSGDSTEGHCAAVVALRRLAVAAAVVVAAATPRPAAADDARVVEPSARIFFDHGRFRWDGATQPHATRPTSVRLGVSGSLRERGSYRIESELADAFASDEGRAKLRHGYVSYELADRWSLTAGQTDPPFSLHAESSLAHLPLMERALPIALAPTYRLAAIVRHDAGTWGAAAGVLGNAVARDDLPDRRGRGASARVFGMLIERDRWQLHAGASLASWRTGERRARLEPAPESALTDRRFVDTGELAGVRAQRATGLEAYLRRGATALHAEHLQMRVARDAPLSRPAFHGQFVTLSHFLTGESRRIDAGRGVFERVQPKGSHGAFELAARISRIDLSDADVQGGMQRQFALGLNWYPNRYARLMANYIHGRARNGEGAARFRILQFRAQFDF
ncbi:MAG TPA: porin [Burkholderiaceae bacterium]|nr:porin [Burkholderiaceae bacterium]